MVEDFILWDVVNISHLNLVSYKLICGLALILFSLFYRSMHDSFPRSLPRCCFPSLGLTWSRGSRGRRSIPWRSASRLGRFWLYFKPMCIFTQPLCSCNWSMERLEHMKPILMHFLKQTYPGELVVQTKPKGRSGKRGSDDACSKPKLSGQGTNWEQGL